VNTGYISPQFHVIFDDKFETVNSLPAEQTLDKQWAEIIKLGRECFLDIDYDKNDLPILPSLSDLIKEYSKAKAIQKENEPTISVEFEPVDSNAYQPPNPLESPSENPVIPPTPVNQHVNPPTFPSTDLPLNIVPGGDNGETIPWQETTATGGVETPSVDNWGVEAPNENTAGRPRRNNVGTYKDGPAIIRRLPIKGESYDFSFTNNVIQEWEHLVPAVANRGRTSEYHPNQKVQQGYLAECYLLQDS
jgi:hypothetical protein